MEYHNDSVNALCFSKLNSEFLVSGGSDKALIIWKIINTESHLKSEKLRIIKTNADVSEITMNPLDQMMFVGCIDNNIYVWKSNFMSNTFELVSTIAYHTNFITSICLNPVQDTSTYRMASYSDDARLVISEITGDSAGNIKVSLVKDYQEFINVKNKINSIHKKIEY